MSLWRLVRRMPLLSLPLRKTEVYCSKVRSLFWSMMYVNPVRGNMTMTSHRTTPDVIKTSSCDFSALGLASSARRPLCPADAYRTLAVSTASARQLGEMLYDGVMAVFRQALDAMDAGDIHRACDLLARGQLLVRQMRDSLSSSVSGRDSRQLVYLVEQVLTSLAEVRQYHRRHVLSQTIAMLAGQRRLWDRFLEGNRPVCKRRNQTVWVG